MTAFDAFLVFSLLVVGILIHARQLRVSKNSELYDLNRILLSAFTSKYTEFTTHSSQKEYLHDIRECLYQSHELSTESFQKELKKYLEEQHEKHAQLLKTADEVTAELVPTANVTLVKSELTDADTLSDSSDTSGISIESLDSILESEEIQSAEIPPIGVDTSESTASKTLSKDLSLNKTSSLTTENTSETLSTEISDASVVADEPALSSSTLQDLEESLTLTNEYLIQIYELIQVYRENISDTALEVMYLALKDYAAEPDARSIVRGQNDTESIEYLTSFDILYQVTLAEHVYNVTLNLSRELQKLPGVSHRYVSDYLILALYHDLGKLQKHRGASGEYRLLDHPVLAARLLQERFPEISEKIVQAIANHHKPAKAVNTQQHLVLRNADIAARQAEIKSRSTLLPTLQERLTKETLIQQLISAYQHILRNDDGSGKPQMTVVHGYLLVAKSKLIAICEYYLNRHGGLCKEQVESEERFHSAIYLMLVDYSLTTRELIDSQVSVSRRRAGRVRTFKMHNYLALPIENLGLLDSTLPTDLFGTQYKDIHFS